MSTDKAVRPVSVMGATKRAAELVVLELQRQFATTMFAAVRFGNVLGSNGSVIPIFKRQLEAGQPLTVTHPEASRYFMTIPEAVQLILQASLLPSVRGSIAMLEMGAPVRIVDLARNLLRLAGVAQDNGHGIVYTGLRPGERIHETLVAPDEETVETEVPKVRLVRNQAVTAPPITALVSEWDAAAGDEPATRLLSFLVEFCMAHGEQALFVALPETDLRTMANILVTGGRGFIGTNLTGELRSRGHHVWSCDILQGEDPQPVKADCGVYQHMDALFRRQAFEFVYHLVAEYGRWNGEDHYENLRRTNVIGTKNMLRLQEQHRFRMVFFSSAEVYGDYDQLMVEDVMERVPIKQMNDYAISKWAGELQRTAHWSRRCAGTRGRHPYP